MKEKLVIIGANDFQNQLILKAKELGYETHVFAWKDGSIGERTADYFYPISIIEKEQILEECKKINPVGVCSIASDLAAVTVTYLSEQLHLNSNTYESVFACTNKYEMRKKLRKNNISTPGFVKVSADKHTWDFSGLELPVIVKPTDRSGSRGVFKITDFSQIDEAIKVATEYSFEKQAIVEDYIEGNEYSCECISYHGVHTFLAITKKFTTGAPHFIETGHMEPSDLSEEQIETVKSEVFKALDALEIKNSASHSEFKLDKNGNVKIIEIGARMGGDCIGSDLVYLSTGYDFVKMVIDVAVNNEPELVRDRTSQKCYIKFLFNQTDLDELEEFKKNHSDKIYRISEIEYSNIGKTVDSSTRLGYYIYFE